MGCEVKVRPMAAFCLSMNPTGCARAAGAADEPPGPGRPATLPLLHSCTSSVRNNLPTPHKPTACHRVLNLQNRHSRKMQSGYVFTEAKTASRAAASQRFWWGLFSFRPVVAYFDEHETEKSPHLLWRWWGLFSFRRAVPRTASHAALYYQNTQKTCFLTYGARPLAL